MLWSHTPHRPARDIDFLGFGHSRKTGLCTVFRDLCSMPDRGDGVTFDPDCASAEPIWDGTEYDGMWVMLTGQLACARRPLQADIEFGNAVTNTGRWNVPASALSSYSGRTGCLNQMAGFSLCHRDL